MSPTLILLSHRAYKSITITFLTAWILVATGFAVFSFTDSWGYVDHFLSLTLLGYLLCRLIVVFQKSSRDSSWAYTIVNANSRSRRRALATLLFACGWIFTFLCKIMIMTFVTILSGAVIASHMFPEFELTLNEMDPAELTPEIEKVKTDMESTKEIIAQFHEDAGYDPVKLFGWMPPKLLISCVVAAWFSFGTLGFYLTRLSWKSLKRACMLPTPIEANPPEKQYGA
ncbi:hypothetical protein N7456_011059 [Penicillium angulare]|uniref:Uncharacterized protein n=1 Tax=Penicillium angulare TaxID=116970 RepID=A0A9W9ET13_9EURO|nr:hypothetical protein N7456_011059 [Penicillium angulare]